MKGASTRALIILDPMRVGDRLQYVELNVCSRKLRNRGTLTIADRLKQARTIRRIRDNRDIISNYDRIMARGSILISIMSRISLSRISRPKLTVDSTGCVRSWA